MTRRINVVFIPSNDQSAIKPWCNRCRVYFKQEPDGGHWYCDRCGTTYTESIQLPAKVLKADVSEPFIASKKTPTERDSDLPNGAYWVSDTDDTL